MKNQNIRQGYITQYLGPTNFRGSRVKASCFAGSLTVGWDDTLNVEENHYRAVKALQKKLGRTGELIGGGHPQGSGNVWVELPKCYADAKAAVIETRHAMRRGENNGNPHCRDFGKMIDKLCEGEFAPFAEEYEAGKGE